jgi:hypothetical protein
VVSVTTDSILVRDPELDAADLDGNVVVLSVQVGSYFNFNGVASEIWQMLAGPRRVADIFEALTQSHDVDTATLSRDVLPFLQTLIDRGLARRLDPDGAA